MTETPSLREALDSLLRIFAARPDIAALTGSQERKAVNDARAALAAHTPPADDELAAIRERCEKARATVSDLCGGRQRWVMCVPAQPDRDPDLVISASLRDIPALLSRLDAERARAERAEAEVERLTRIKDELRAAAIGFEELARRKTKIHAEDIAALKARAERLEAEVQAWKVDSAAAWDKCEERRLVQERLEAEVVGLARIIAARDAQLTEEIETTGKFCRQMEEQKARAEAAEARAERMREDVVPAIKVLRNLLHHADLELGVQTADELLAALTEQQEPSR